MKLKILGSSSRGNCYLLIAESGETLALEAGVRFSEAQKAMNFKTNDIVGCLVTHEHGDHAGHVSEFLNHSIDVLCSEGTASKIKATRSHRLHTLIAGNMVAIGNFKVIPFNVIHDAAEPFGYLINHAECGNVLFLTDTYYSEYTFKGLNNLLLECNYDENILQENIEQGRINPTVKRRIETSHMSLQTAIQLLDANDLTAVNNIVLIHLSENNSHAENFKQAVKSATGKNVFVADAGMELNFGKTPF